ncbi:type VI secretion system baseplate subunit TssK [Kalamiella sp. sgz302252]|uniref:type VI secretion system baseplate subunit TssK n=1 Tax=Pantoea sp. sgz302252 TaxID=3341827 RepID=UPI0036D22873
MKIYRPLWSEGSFLAPQQFQQQARWDGWVTEILAEMAIAQPWGVIRAEFDLNALSLSQLKATSLAVRFPDGTLIDTALSDNLPPACELSDMDDRQSVEVVLALPLLSASGGNLQDGRVTERPRRWQQEWVVVQDLVGDERTELAVMRHSLTLRFAHQENSAWLTCPLLQLVRDEQGEWVVDDTFMPPLLALSASPALMALLSELLHRLQARQRRLMAMRRESNERMADFAVADVSLFWLLHALNSAEPVLRELHASPSRHPELLWRELARLAGGLMTFSLEHQTDAIPAWQHNRPQNAFPPMFKLLDELLENSLPSRVVRIELIKQGQFWQGDLLDSRLREEVDFYLSVRSSLPGHRLLTQFPLLCKAGSPQQVNTVVNAALQGIPIKALSHVPAAVPWRLENHYFALELHNSAADEMLETGHCAFYVPSSLGEISLEFYAVLHS